MRVISDDTTAPSWPVIIISKVANSPSKNMITSGKNYLPWLLPIKIFCISQSDLEVVGRIYISRGELIKSLFKFTLFYYKDVTMKANEK